MKKEFAICQFWTGETFEVRVMARAEGYAMVRRKGAMPLVVCEKKLTPISKGTNGAPRRPQG